MRDPDASTRRHPAARLLLTAAAALLIAIPRLAAAQATPTPTKTATPTPQLVRLELAPATAKRVVGGFVNYTVTGHRSDGSTVLMTQQVVYASQDPTVAEAPNADPNHGRVNAVGVGTTTISVSDPATGVTSTSTGDDATITVDPLPTITPTPTATVTSTNPTATPTATPTRTTTPTPQLVRLEINPNQATRNVGSTINYTVTGHRSDGSTLNLTQQVVYTATNTGVAQAPNADPNHGTVDVVGPGTTTITATHPGTGLTSTQTGDDATLAVPTPPTPTPSPTITPTSTGPTPTRTATPTRTVTPTPVIVRLEIQPKTAQRDVGTFVNYTVTGHRSDGSTVLLTQQVVYSSSDPSIAEAPNADPNHGRVNALSPGAATISVVHPASGVSSTSTDDDATLTVPEPPTPTLSATPTPTSTNPTPTATPTATRTATPTPALIRLELSPHQKTTGVGTTVNYTVTGHRSDGSTLNLTQKVVYGSTDTNVAVAPNMDPNHGTVNVVGSGTSTITATEPSSGLTTTDTDDDATLTVPAQPTATVTATPTVTSTAPTPTPTLSPTRTVTPSPALVRLELKPHTKIGSVGSSVNYTVTGHRSDGSTLNLTQKVTYESTDPSVAVAPNADPNHGAVNVIGVGTTTIKATEATSGLTTGATNDDATLTVPQPPTPTISATRTPTSTAPTGSPTPSPTKTATPTPRVVALEIKPATATKHVGDAINYTVTGHRDDGSTVLLTQKVTYASSDPTVAVAPNVDPNHGRVNAVGIGTATISATEPSTGVTTTATLGDATLTVQAATGPTVTPTSSGSGGSSTPQGTPTPLGVGLPGDAAKAAVKCQAAIKSAGVGFATRKLKTLDHCASRMLACVQTKPNDDGCRTKAAAACSRDVAKITAAETKLAAAVVKRCTVVGMNDLRDDAGLGFDEVAATCASDFGSTFTTDVGSLASCVVNQHECRVEELFTAVMPRAGEMLRLAGADLGAGSCLADLGGTGADVGNVDTGKQIVKCEKALTRAASRFAGKRLKALERCVDAVFSCLQLSPLDPRCVSDRAHSRCDRALASASTDATALTATVADRCAGVAIDTLRDAGGVNVDGLAAQCSAVQVASTTTVADYQTCLARRQTCGVEELLAFEAPRAGELLQLVGRTLHSAFCPAP